MKDLHLHLSGATSPVALYEIVRESGVKMAAQDFEHFKNSLSMKRDRIHNLDDYLSVIHAIDLVQSHPLAIERSTYDAFVSAYLGGASYVELRWNPYKRSRDFQIDLDRLILSAYSGLTRARAIFGVKGAFLYCLGRDISPEANAAIFKKARQYHAKQMVLGIDVAGSEQSPLPEYMLEYFKQAHALGMVTTIHCGETYYEGVEAELSRILTEFRPARIGHGIQLVNHPHLLKQAARQNVQLEICISSNLMTGAVADLEEFGRVFAALEGHGVPYCLCTDALAPLGTTIAREHAIFEGIKKSYNLT